DKSGRRIRAIAAAGRRTNSLGQAIQRRHFGGRKRMVVKPNAGDRSTGGRSGLIRIHEKPDTIERGVNNAGSIRGVEPVLLDAVDITGINSSPAWIRVAGLS